jgi:hypothetical protein
MKYLLALVMLVALPVSAEWESVGATDDEEVYIDMDTVRISNDLRMDNSLRRVWTLTNRSKKGRLGEMSLRILREIDCKQERIRVLSMTGFTGAMGSGSSLPTYRGDNDPWDYIAPKTFAYYFYLKACAK